MFKHQDVLQTAGAAVREAGLDPCWDKAATSAGCSLGHGYVMLLNGRLATAEGDGDLSPAMVPGFFQLPVEALRRGTNKTRQG
jgi:hypothetical protein